MKKLKNISLGMMLFGGIGIFFDTVARLNENFIFYPNAKLFLMFATIAVAGYFIYDRITD